MNLSYHINILFEGEQSTELYRFELMLNSYEPF